MARTPKTTRGEAGDAPPAGAPNLQQLLELWFALSRREWTSLVIVPADPQGSTAALAKSLADVGQRLSFVPITAIAVNSLEFGSALALADLQQHIGRMPASAPPIPAAAPPEPTPGEPTGDAPADPGNQALMLPPHARLVISIPPVVCEPLGLPAAHEADAVIVAVWMTRSRLTDVRRTLDLVGRERVLGAILMH